MRTTGNCTTRKARLLPPPQEVMFSLLVCLFVSSNKQKLLNRLLNFVVKATDGP